jgi:peptidoglycan L-alanyl-D-glutamate endopeptidase CwlK
MMPYFGSKSLIQRDTCHPDLQVVLNELIKIIDYSITCGVREDEEQFRLFKIGREQNKSGEWVVVGKTVTNIDGKTKKSKHQKKDDGFSHAVDIAPYPLDYSDDNKKRARFYFLMGAFEGVAQRLHEEGRILHKFRYGLDWDNDRDFNDQSFDDLPHIEMRT